MKRVAAITSRLWPLAMAGLVSACASGMSSSVGTITDSDAKVLAPEIVAFVQSHTKPAAGPIDIEAPPRDLFIGPVLRAKLQEAGYTVTDAHAAHTLAYQAGALDDGVMLRISLDGGEAARFYRRSDGGTTLQASGPLSIRTAS